MADQARMRLLKGDKDKTVMLINWGKEVVFYGEGKSNPLGKVDPGKGKRIPANSVFWVTGNRTPNVEIKD